MQRFEVIWQVGTQPCVIGNDWERQASGIIVARYSREELALCTDIAKLQGPRSGEDMYQGGILGMRTTTWIVHLPDKCLLLIWHMNATVKDVTAYLVEKGYEKFTVFPVLAGEFVIEEVTMRVLCPDDRRGVNETGQVIIDTDVSTPEQVNGGDVLIKQAGLEEEEEAW